ncbi:MAG: electron transfer flavoprotein subunit beta/FixA family protein [Lentisphaeria bacterium]|nr:electron transfer flavoprotein subunit beta/FixA family protein [Lentisphaeria bacterium]
MNIAVCIKQVPDTTELKLDPVTNTLIREGVESVLNPLDDFPLEAALRLRETLGGRVTAVTMGPPQAEDVLRKAVAMGADAAILASDRAFAGSDTWATSLTLARVLEAAGPFDLILCGKQAIDGDTAQVGPGIAAHLDLPQVTYVTALRCRDGALEVARMMDAGTAWLRLRLPAVLTVLKDANEPRLPSLAGRLRSLTFTPRRAALADTGLEPTQAGLEGSPTRVVRIAVPTVRRRQERLEGDAATVAARLVSVLATRPGPTGEA